MTLFIFSIRGGVSISEMGFPLLTVLSVLAGGEWKPLTFAHHGVGGELLSSMVGKPSPQTSPL